MEAYHTLVSHGLTLTAGKESKFQILAVLNKRKQILSDLFASPSKVLSTLLPSINSAYRFFEVISDRYQSFNISPLAEVGIVWHVFV